MSDSFLNALSKSSHSDMAQPESAQHRKLRKATKAFEAIFVKELLKVATPKMAKGLFGGGMAEEFFQDFMLDERSKAIVDGGGVGLAKVLEDEIMAIESRKLKVGDLKADKLKDLHNQKRAQQVYQER